MAMREFKTAESFYAWLAKNHDKADEIWIKIHKVGSGLKSITPKETIDAVLEWVPSSARDKVFSQNALALYFA